MNEENHEDLRRAVREVCTDFPNEYWRALDEKREYPEAFVQAMTESGYLGALIPKEYGGMGLGLCAACVILEEVNRSGANAGPAHAQMYTMGTLLRHGSEEQKTEYLPKIASGELRLQAFGVTEPEAGTDTTRLKTSAVLIALWAFPVFWFVDTRSSVLISLALMVGMIFHSMMYGRRQRFSPRCSARRCVTVELLWVIRSPPSSLAGSCRSL